jgi:hypothetical protein
MGQAEIAKSIETNLADLQLDTLFSTKRKLFEKLGIPEKEDAKQIEKVLKGYVKWEKTGIQNKNHRTSNEIRITNINNDYHYLDGRNGNGGAHNNVYITQLKPLLLHSYYKDIMTAKAIAEDIYGFQRKVFDNNNEDSGIAFYTTTLENKIAAITETALKSLKEEEFLEYEKVLVVVSAYSYALPFGIPSYTDVMENPFIFWDCGANKNAEIVINLESQNVKEMLCNSRPWLDDLVFKAIAEEILQKTEKKFSFDVGSVMDFLDIVVEYNININLLFTYDEPKKPEQHIAWAGESILINGVTSSIREHLKYSPIECRMNPKKKKELYRRTDIFWKLIGWIYIYNALQIKIKNTSNDIYPMAGDERTKLRKNLDNFIIKEVNKKFVVVNAYENILGNDKYEGKRTENRRYWVAENENVKKRHCEIFEHSMDEQIFRENTFEIVNVESTKNFI